MKELPGAREPDPRSDRRMPTMQQGADRCRKRQECDLSALCPPPRVPQAEQGPQHEGESRPGRLQQVPLLPVRLTAQAGPARAARLAHGAHGRSTRSDSMPSKKPTRCIRKYTPGATDFRPGTGAVSRRNP